VLFATSASVNEVAQPPRNPSSVARVCECVGGKWRGSEGTFRQRDYIVQQAGSKKELMYRKWPWKLIIQSNQQLTTFDAIALYDLQDNPFEKQAGNLVSDPQHKSRVDEMLREHLEILRSRQRTGPDGVLTAATTKSGKKIACTGEFGAPNRRRPDV
jgi:hypothetical protein